MPEQPAPRGVREDLDAVCADIAAALAPGEPALVRTVRHLVQRDLRRSTSLQQAALRLETRMEQLERVHAELHRGRERLGRLRDALLERDPFGTEWQERVRLELAAGAPGDGADAWLRRYAEAFTASSYDACLWLCDSDGPRPEPSLVAVLRRTAEAGRRRARAYTLPGLELLTGADGRQVLPPDTVARCWCMRARVVCGDLDDPEQAVQLLVPVVQAADPWSRSARAMLHVVLGECRLALADLDGARQHVRAALAADAADLGAMVLKGLIAEAQGNVPRAQQAYDAALDVDRDRAVSGRLFAPVPPVLLWRYGRRLREEDPERAVTAIRRALAQGSSAPSLPQHKAYVDLARTLECLDRPADAAAAYWSAGRRYADAADRMTATTFLERASSLAPERHEYRSTLAQALCREAVREDGLVDLALLDRARDHWQAAMRVTASEPASCDDYLTGASLAHLLSGDVYRPRPSYGAVLVLERGLLVRPEDVRTLARLSQAHRLVGHFWTARRLAERPGSGGEDDDALLDQQLLALLELDRADEALEVLDRRGAEPGKPWLANRRVQALLHLGRSAQALQVLAERAVADGCLHWLQLGLCQWLRGDPRAARESHQRAREADGASGRCREYLVAWADHLLGSYDDAARVLEQLVRRDPLDPALRRELAQVLLGRGGPDDLVRGAALLADGVAASRSAYALATLTRLDLPRLVAATGDRPHGRKVAAVVAQVSRQADEVRRRLAAADEQAELVRTLTLDDGPFDDQDAGARTAACRAALARTADEQEDLVGAVRDDVALAVEHGVPEARLGVERAVRRACRRVDVIAREGGPADRLDGRRLCEQLAAVVAHLDAGAAPCGAALHVRGALLAAQDGDVPAFAGHVAAATAADPSALRDVVDELVDRPSAFWELRTAARRVQADPASTSAQRGAAHVLEDALHLAAPLRSRRRDVDGSRLFPLVVPLALRLGPGLLVPGAPDGDRRWRLLLQALWDRVLQELGVPLPGIAVEPLPDHGPTAWSVELYGERRASGAATAGTTVGVPTAQALDAATHEVVGAVEQVVLGSLNRLFSLDDAALWLSGAPARPSAATAPGFGPTDSLEVQRLLRLLLREHVPILDHDAVLDEVRAAGPGWSAPLVLPQVRLRVLRAAALPVLGRPGPTVPEDLETALCGGLDVGDPSLWQLPRAAAVGVVERLLTWYREVGAPASVVVRDPALRTPLWRLLAVSVHGPVGVLTEEESGAR